MLKKIILITLMAGVLSMGLYTWAVNCHPYNPNDNCEFTCGGPCGIASVNVASSEACHQYAQSVCGRYTYIACYHGL